MTVFTIRRYTFVGDEVVLVRAESPDAAIGRVRPEGCATATVEADGWAVVAYDVVRDWTGVANWVRR